MKKIAVVQFLGTNCDRDVFSFVQLKGYRAEYVWHADQFDPKNYEAVILPGGFSSGDYLRSGALAAKTPVMKSVAEAAKSGRPVMGVCNGFQILCEAGLLPGVLMKNKGLRFIDDFVDVHLVNKPQFWTPRLAVSGAKIKIPVAHGDGRYFLGEAELKKLEDRGGVWLRYVANPNGSVNDIAGVMNEQKNVVALMPHPERAIYDWMGSRDGAEFL